MTGGGATCYSDYHALLADPAVTAVSIVLPDYLHRAAAVAVAEAAQYPAGEAAGHDRGGCAGHPSKRCVNGVTLMVDFHKLLEPAFSRAKVSG